MKKEFYNTELAKVVDVAKKMGLKVWTFESSSSKIKQIFFDDGKTFGTAHVDCGVVTFGTCHKACRSCGTGFGVPDGGRPIEELILASLVWAPEWAYGHAKREGIIKETFAQHIKSERVLKYYEL